MTMADEIAPTYGKSMRGRTSKLEAAESAAVTGVSSTGGVGSMGVGAPSPRAAAEPDDPKLASIKPGLADEMAARSAARKVAAAKEAAAAAGMPKPKGLLEKLKGAVGLD
jgi:hypothetical protein